MAGPALADDIALTPASPQPDEAAMRQGLHVVYAYPQDVKSIAKPGPFNNPSLRDRLANRLTQNRNIRRTTQKLR